MNVIVVDDEVEGNLQNTCRLIKDFYSCNRGQVEFIKTSTKALEYLSVHSEEVDLAILDHYLSGSPMTGVKLGETISLNYPHIALVMMTANPSVSLCTEAMELGFNSFLTKGSDTSPKAKLFLSLERLETLSSVQAKQKQKQHLQLQKEQTEIERKRANDNLNLFIDGMKPGELMMTEVFLACLELFCSIEENLAPIRLANYGITLANVNRILPKIENKLKTLLDEPRFTFKYLGSSKKISYRLTQTQNIINSLQEIGSNSEYELFRRELNQCSADTKIKDNRRLSNYFQEAKHLKEVKILLQKYPKRWELSRKHYKNLLTVI